MPERVQVARRLAARRRGVSGHYVMVRRLGLPETDASASRLFDHLNGRKDNYLEEYTFLRTQLKPSVVCGCRPK